MRNWVRIWVRGTIQIIDLLRKAGEFHGIKAKFQALVYLSFIQHDKIGHTLRSWLLPLHEAWIKPMDGLISLPVQFSGISRRLFLRKGNVADYQVAGEMLYGFYRQPTFVPKVIYDCGANIGLFTLYAAACFPSAKIVCFEPDQNNLALLRKNFTENGITADIREAGVWDKTCTIYYHAGSSTVDGYTNEEPSPFPVPVEKLEFTDADVWIKLDVEGAEFRVLPVMLNAHPLPRYISLELHNFNTKEGQELFELIRTSGYRFHGYYHPDNICGVFDAELT